jgi:predicted neuraminidase
MPTPSCHASTIVESNRELMAAWFGGAGEGRPDINIYGAKRSNGKWEVSGKLAREKDTTTWNRALFRGPDQLLWFYYKFGTSPREWSAGRRVSRDDGRRWSQAEHLPAALTGCAREEWRSCVMFRRSMNISRVDW